MVEAICNAIQLILTGACTVISLLFAFRSKARVWLLLALFSGVFFLGDLYWYLFLVFYQKTPQYSYVSDLSWDAAYLFLFLLLIQVRNVRIMPYRMMMQRKKMWAIPAFTACMCIFFMQWGDYINNIATAVLMTGLMLYSSDGIIAKDIGNENDGRFRLLHIIALVFCFSEYIMWIFSCFWMGDTLINPYFWFDILLSGTFILFPVALRKGVQP